MKIIFPNFNKANVLVAGDVMLDKYWYGSMEKISPEAPVPIIRINTLEERPGGAANVAINITSLGGKVQLMGLIGHDDSGIILKKNLIESYVNCDLIVLDDFSTITKLRIISHNQHIMRLDFEKKFDINPNLLYEHIKSKLSTFKVLVLSDYSKGFLNNIQSIISLARSIGVLVLVDPKGSDLSRYRGADLLTPNILEFELAINSCCRNEDELISKGMQVMIDYEISAILVTRADKGMTLLRLDKDPITFPSQAKKIYDVIGAGDTVIAVLAASLSVGCNIEYACSLANIAAGIVVGKFGTATVSDIELSQASYVQDYNFGVVDENTLNKMIMISKSIGETIVMTNGVFDILHVGHINYLTRAKQLGDRLIVAVNNDESTKRLKGNIRPINSLSQRMSVLAALGVVDWVVPFCEDTPKRLIASVLPDFLVKGGDYKICDIDGSEEVLSSGGEIRILDIEDDISTSNIIDTIKNQ